MRGRRRLPLQVCVLGALCKPDGAGEARGGAASAAQQLPACCTWSRAGARDRQPPSGQWMIVAIKQLPKPEWLRQQTVCVWRSTWFQARPGGLRWSLLAAAGFCSCWLQWQTPPALGGCFLLPIKLRLLCCCNVCWQRCQLGGSVAWLTPTAPIAADTVEDRHLQHRA